MNTRTLLLAAVLGIAACDDPTAAERLEIDVSLDRTSLAPPGEVEIRLRVLNPTSRTVRLSGGGSSTVWAVVRSSQGTIVRQLRGYTDDLRTWTITAGDSLVIVDSWDGRSDPSQGGSIVAAGTYEVVGRLTAHEARRSSAPVSLAVLSAP